ncbi:heme exporter protein CcmD [Leisingera sp. ANG-Vp]|uniref:heme exporter protein CcmD n=1 Tax=Leisingera sp. ANG-Vp TaxID=1577896 RepID=UPI00057FC3DD|nr:heme exporter protein CcmD [Leisingera sp. ANG-Vp]KIC17564.1 hemagglutination activity protein [Leisingera sp. ANG-Vp]
MPDLGKYADTVLSAYGASLVLLAALVVLTIWRGRKVRREMETLETRMKRNG